MLAFIFAFSVLYLSVCSRVPGYIYINTIIAHATNFLLIIIYLSSSQEFIMSALY